VRVVTWLYAFHSFWIIHARNLLVIFWLVLCVHRRLLIVRRLQDLVFRFPRNRFGFSLRWLPPLNRLDVCDWYVALVYRPCFLCVHLLLYDCCSASILSPAAVDDRWSLLSFYCMIVAQLLFYLLICGSSLSALFSLCPSTIIVWSLLSKWTLRSTLVSSSIHVAPKSMKLSPTAHCLFYTRPLAIMIPLIRSHRAESWWFIILLIRTEENRVDPAFKTEANPWKAYIGTDRPGCSAFGSVSHNYRSLIVTRGHDIPKKTRLANRQSRSVKHLASRTGWSGSSAAVCPVSKSLVRTPCY